MGVAAGWPMFFPEVAKIRKLEKPETYAELAFVDILAGSCHVVVVGEILLVVRFV